MENSVGRRLVGRDYTRWGMKVKTWSSLEDFARSKFWASGVHSIPLSDGNVIDVFISADIGDKPVFGHTLTVFFSGALTGREGTHPPYFSGANLGSQLGLPYIAISDPTLNLNEEIGLAWYAGYEGGRVQDSISKLLTAFAEQGSLHLLLVGGSGGGFAAMYYASRLGDKASAFVWNPQTSISEYAPDSVHRYLAIAVPGHRFDTLGAEAERKLSEAGIVSRNLQFHGRRLFYLQNYNDWHVRVHLAPYLDSSGLVYRGNGLYSSSQNQVAVIAAFGEGHAVPDKSLIFYVIEEMINPTRSVRVIYNDLVKSGRLPSDFNRLPLDLRETWRGTLPVSLKLTQGPEGETNAALDGIPNGFGAVTASVSLLLRGKRVAFSDRSEEKLRTFERVEYDTAKAQIFDGFGHYLGDINVSVGVEIQSENNKLAHRDAGKRRVFVYGSCVSRDAFQGEDSLELVEYVSRSAMGSSFASPINYASFIDLSLNPSPFQQRMVTYDLEKSLSRLLINADFDFLLLDFIDERLPLVPIGESFITFSPEAQRCGLVPDEVVKVGSPEYFRLFAKGLESLLSVVPSDKILVSRVYWASHDRDGMSLGNLEWINGNNAVLDDLYRIVGQYPEVRFIEYSEDMIIGDKNHKWGPSPFHYVEQFYERTRNGLQRL